MTSLYNFENKFDVARVYEYIFDDEKINNYHSVRKLKIVRFIFVSKTNRILNVFLTNAELVNHIRKIFYISGTQSYDRLNAIKIIH